MGERVRLLALLLALQLASISVAVETTTSNSNSPKVAVELYSESLCPFCAIFIINHLSKFFSNGLIDIVDLEIIPFGNAKLNSSTGSFICQHGPDECKLNIIQSCAINLWPNGYEWFPFIYCLESLPRTTAASTWKKCGSTVPDLALVEDCYEGPIGLQLEKEFAKVTNELQPPHKYVPWVLVNKQPLYEDYENVEKYVCDAYKGSKPNSCKTFESRSPLELMVNDRKCLRV